MKLVAVALLVLAVCSVVIGTPAISEVRQPQNKPGRFLSLPVPAKCSQSELLTTHGRTD